MPESDGAETGRLQRLQTRIGSALRESQGDRARSRFSDYRYEPGPDPATHLMRAAASGGIEGIEAALDEFDRLAADDDRRRWQHALLIFLTHHPDVPKLGLHVPGLQEQSPWKVRPSDGPA
jgi:hypothetical protein